MGLIKSLSRLKLKKLQPGKILLGAAKLGVATAVGGPLGAAAAVAIRVGKKVDQAKTVIDKTTAAIKQEAKDLGISTGDAAERVVDAALKGAGSGVDAQRAAAQTEAFGASTGGGALVAIGAVLLVVLLVRSK